MRPPTLLAHLPLLSLLLLLLTPTAAPTTTTTTTLTRLDRLTPRSLALKPHAFHSNSLPLRPRAATPSSSSSSSSFDISFFCPDSPKQLCDHAQKAFERSGEYISDLLSITVPIKIHATFMDFCNGVPKEKCGDPALILGQASPAAYFPAHIPTASPSSTSPSTTPWRLYPQALVKQLKTSPQDLEFAPYDILAEFNSAFDLWFKDSGSPISPNQTDFDFLITHEITHGLGWDTSLVDFTSMYDFGAAGKRALAVAPFLYTHGPIANPKADTWSYLTAFDAQIKDSTGKRVSDTLESVTSWRPDHDGEITLETFVTQFEASPAFSAAKDLYQTVVSGPASLLLANNVTLHTISAPAAQTPANPSAKPKAATFEAGSSITHLSSAYEQTADFLMLAYNTGVKGLSMADLLKKFNAKGVYGPATLEGLKAIGWGVDGKPSTLEIVVGNIAIGDDVESTAYRVPHGVSILGVIVLATVACVL